VNLPAPLHRRPCLLSYRVTAERITTLHRFSLLPPLQRGRQEVCTVTWLQGTAGWTAGTV